MSDTTARAAAGMGAITAVSRALGFVRVLVILLVLGTTYLGDAFNQANLVSNVLFELLAAGALSAVLVPSFVNLLETGDRRGAEDVAGGVLGAALLLLGGVTAVGVIGAPWLARLLTFGVDPAVAADQRELITYLLRFFVPQVMLYAGGTIATAILYAYRRFAVTAAAPIGNTLVMVAFLVAFRVVAGDLGDSGAPVLSGGERLLLAAAGTGGVVAFVGSLLLACSATGFRLRPRWPGGDRRVVELVRHSGWGVALHSAQGMLLGGAVVAGAAVEGGVVAYHSAWVFFLAPYGILAQPIHTAVLPELATEARQQSLDRMAVSLRWAMERMALFVLPVTAGMVALALPAMRLVSSSKVDPGLLAAALAGLGLGLYAYSSFLLMARGYYALGDSRTPGVVALASGAAGVVVMVVSVGLLDGAALVGALGVGHSVAYGAGLAVLGRGLGRRVGSSLWPQVVTRIGAVAAVIGLLVWAGTRLGPAEPTRLADLGLLAAAGLAGSALVLAGYRVAGVRGALSHREPTGPGGAAAPGEDSGDGGVGSGGAGGDASEGGGDESVPEVSA